VIDTDALNLMRVDLERRIAPNDSMGSRVWHVSVDRSLSRAERHLVEEAVVETGLTMLCSNWVNLLGPCLPPDDARARRYVAHLVQSQLGLLAEDPLLIDKDFLLTVTNPLFPVADLLAASPARACQQLARMQRDEEVDSLLREPKPEEPEWTAQFERAMRRVLEDLERSPEHEAELVAHAEARAAAEKRAAEEQGARVQLARELAEAKKTAEERESQLTEERDALEQELAKERDKGLFARLFGR
jgi:hypothetical protein